MKVRALQTQRGEPEDGREALRALYVKYGGSVMGRCHYLLKDKTRAEDAMQDVFAKALLHHAEFRRQASPLTWLMKISTHHCLNLIRAERAPWWSRFQQEKRAEPEAAGGAQVMESRELVRALLARFDLETQRAVVHYYLDEMTLEEVGTVLGRSIPTVRKRLQSFCRVAGTELPGRAAMKELP